METRQQIIDRLYELVDAADSCLTKNYCYRLYELASQVVDPILEIGVWKGRSMVFLAEGAKLAGVHVFGVDGYAHGQYTIEASPTIPHLNMAYDECLARIASLGLSDHITLITKISSQAIELIHSRQWGLVHIDGDHSKTGVATDIDLVKNNVVVGGRIVFHDSGYIPGGGGHAGIDEAIDEFIAANDDWVEDDPVTPCYDDRIWDSANWAYRIIARS